eukprot:COSAG01_NODE_52_length_31456_cov_125.226648_18_plen_104_part_00
MFFKLLLCIIFSATLCSVHTHAIKDLVTPNYQFRVKGMVCSFCAQGLTRLFNKKEEIKKLDVDFKAQSISIFIHDNQNLSKTEIIKVIRDAGYELDFFLDDES